MRGGHVFYLNHHLTSHKSFSESYINYISITSNYEAFHKSLHFSKLSEPKGSQAGPPRRCPCRTRTASPAHLHLPGDRRVGTVSPTHASVVPKLTQVYHSTGKTRDPVCPRSFCLEIKFLVCNMSLLIRAFPPFFRSRRKRAASQNPPLGSPRKRSKQM